MGKTLIIADPDDKKSVAISRGLELALRLQQQVDVVGFTYVPLGSVPGGKAKQEEVRKRLLAERKAQVQAQIDLYAADDQDIGLKIAWEKDLEGWVSKHCVGDRYRAVIKTGNRTDSLVHTSTDWQLLRKCPVPVLLISEKKWHKGKPVLVTLDLATKVASKKKLNEKLLAYGAGLSQALEVPLEILCAIEIPTLLQDLDLVDPIAYEKDARADMEPLIAGLAKKFDIPESTFHMKRGPVEKVITSYAAQVKAQIVVMGTVGRKGVKGRLLGNTAERVLRHLKTDVLALKP